MNSCYIFEKANLVVARVVMQAEGPIRLEEGGLVSDEDQVVSYNRLFDGSEAVLYAVDEGLHTRSKRPAISCFID